MRRWRIVLAGAAMAASALVGAGPAQAANDNSVCRVFTNELRRDLRAAITDPELQRQFNRQFNEVRNDNC